MQTNSKCFLFLISLSGFVRLILTVFQHIFILINQKLERCDLVRMDHQGILYDVMVLKEEKTVSSHKNVMRSSPKDTNICLILTISFGIGYQTYNDKLHEKTFYNKMLSGAATM